MKVITVTKMLQAISKHLQAVIYTAVALGVIGSAQVANSEMTGLLQLVAGSHHTCSLTTSGGAKCWGSNSYGQLGNSSTMDRTTAVNVTGLTSGVSSITAGYYYTCAVTTAGGARCWGRNDYGQLGDGSATDRATAVDVSGHTSGISNISNGLYHTCAVTTSGGAKCWGYNAAGQLGDGSTTDRTTPLDVSGLTSGVSSISSGSFHTCAVTTSGGAKCWGQNTYGQLGDGTTTNRTTAVNVSGLTTGVNSISGGGHHTCAVTTSGGAKCWGYNNRGQLGDGTTTNRTTAVNVSGLTSGVSSISGGSAHTCAVITAGGAKCWGWNITGQLGDGSTTTRTTAVNVSGLSSGVSGIAGGASHNCAVTTSGGAKCWGYNGSGQLGDGSTTTRATAINVSSLTSGVSSISGGGSHTCVVTTSGGAKCWGQNTYGQLGNGTMTERPTAVDVTGLTTGVSSIWAGTSHTCALTTSGSAKCWGWNIVSQLGDGSATDRTTAVNVTGLTSSVSSISLGLTHTCVVTTSGGAKCWGWNITGQLGDGSTTTRATAVNVSGLTTGVNSISGGNSHTCALTTSGGAKCWGSNSYGELGDSTTTTRTTAVDVAGLTSGISSISVVGSHTCAVTTSGGAKCWGYNTYGQLGDGSTTNRTTAVDVSGLTSGVSSITDGGAHTCAVTTSGGAKCWGYNNRGQLGDGSTMNRNTAVDISGLTSGISTITGGSAHTCAVTTAGGAKCWGYDSYGQLGESEPYIHTVLNGFSAQGIVTLSGSPLSGVVLRASGMGPLYATQESTADGSGAYLLPIVETASYTITPELAGYSFAPPSISGTMAADVTQDFVATLITYNITGTVTANASPLSGASVDGGALGTATTNASGVYAFNSITPGTAYTLTVSHSGATFGVDTANGTLNNHATLDFSGTLNAYDITGTITAGGNPLPGVAVGGGGLGSATTDGSGTYSFTGITYGTVYLITPSLVDYDFTPTSAGATLTGNVTHDFAGVYNPPTTTTVATTSVATTTPSTSSPSTSSGLTTSTIVSTTSVATSTTAETTATSSVPTTSAMQTTTVVDSTSTVATTTTLHTTTIPLDDTDNDGITDSEEENIGTDPEVADSDRDGVTDGEEVTTGTNPKDPGSKAPKLRTTICSDWNGYLSGTTGRGMYNIMEHINLTTKKLRVKTELRSIRGHLKDTYEFFLRGSQQFDLLVHDMSGRESNSYGQVCTTYERAPAGSLDGRMVYYKFGATLSENADAGNGIQFAFALPFENPSTGTSALLFNTMQPSLDPQDSGNLVANWVQLSNVSKKRLKGRLYFHRADGTQLTKPVNVNLRDGARYDYSAHAYGANQAGLIRFVPADKTVEYQLREVRYLYDNPGTEDSFASAYPFAAEVGSGQTLIAPVDTTDSSAVLELANPRAAKVNASVKLYDRTGNKLLYSKTHRLKAYGSEHIVLDKYLAAGQGVVVVKGAAVKGTVARTSATNIASLVATVVHYGRTLTGAVKNMYAMPLREPIGKNLVGSYNTYLNQGCTLYLGNVSNAKETVNISLKQGDGKSPMADYKLTVPPRGMLSEDICSKSPPSVYGVVTVGAKEAKRIYGAVVRIGDGGRYKMGTVLR